MEIIRLKFPRAYLAGAPLIEARERSLLVPCAYKKVDYYECLAIMKGEASYLSKMFFS